MKNNAIIVISAAVILLAAAGLTAFLSREKPNPALDAFAQCLAEKKITMYGAAWCAHCQDEKKAFGSSFKYVPYVECPDNPKVCTDKGVNGYPTWIFPDGRQLVGNKD
jgi:hypothetical protein